MREERVFGKHAERLVCCSGVWRTRKRDSGGMKPPPENISGKKHPNLAAAQRHLDMAFEKIKLPSRPMSLIWQDMPLRPRI